MDATPTVPSIAPPQAPQPLDLGSQSIGDLLGTISQRATAPLPDPYTQGVEVAQPHQHDKPLQPTNRNTNNVPITGQVADVKRARRQNAVAGLANTISQAGNMIQQKKQEKLKDQLTDVMKAKQNIANATQISSDPNATPQQKALAQKVLDANKKQLNTILSDPKTQKQMAKALDISFVDPDKNKTPEVQAYQAAMKEFKEAGPFNADNPAEHSVAQIAARQGKGAQAQQQSGQPQSGQPQQQAQPKSATPYADKALAKDLPTIAPNPLYGAAVKQQQDAQKQLAVIVPKLIDASAKQSLEEYKQGNENARAEYKGVTDYQKAAMQAVARMKLADANNKAAMARTAARDATEMATTKARIDAAFKLADNKSLSKEQADAVKANSLNEINKKITSAGTALKNAQTALDQAMANKTSDPALIESLEVQRDNAVRGVSFYNNIRDTKFASMLPSVTPEGVLNGNSGAGTGKGTKVESVGDSDSDEDDNSDDYGNQ